MGGFANQIHDFVAKVKSRSDDVVGLTVAKIAADIDERSPVGNQDLWIFNKGTKESPEYVHWLAYNDPDGYVGGHFRANWQLGVGIKPEGIIEETDPSGDAAQGRINAAIPDDAAGKVYWLVNNLPYAQRLEHGWSTQAPSGMVGLAVTRFGELVEASITEAKAKTP